MDNLSILTDELFLDICERMSFIENTDVHDNKNLRNM